MPSSKAKASASRFVREYGFHEPSLSSLKKIIGKQGYTLVEYNNIYNDEDVSALLAALGLEEYAKRAKGFTYADSNYRLVFVHEDLSDDEKLLVLAHEEGHIFCEHLSSSPVIGRDVIEEYEANEFLHYILKQRASSRIKNQVSQHRKGIIICAAVLALVMIASLVFWGLRNHGSSDYYGDYYITTTGNKYHKANCIFVKGKSTAHRMTQEEYESGDYAPCGVCLSGGD